MSVNGVEERRMQSAHEIGGAAIPATMFANVFAEMFVHVFEININYIKRHVRFPAMWPHTRLKLCDPQHIYVYIKAYTLFQKEDMYEHK